MSLAEFVYKALRWALGSNGWITMPTYRDSGTFTTTLRHKLQIYMTNND